MMGMHPGMLMPGGMHHMGMHPGMLMPSGPMGMNMGEL
jgi:hypothetical protein